MVSDKEQKDRENLFRYDRSELNESEPFDEASKGQDDEQSRWLRLHLRYKHNRYRITGCVSSGVKAAGRSVRRSNGTSEVSVVWSNYRRETSAQGEGDTLAADQIVVEKNGL